MWARIARFEGDPADIDTRIERLRSMLETDGLPPELADARFLLLVDRTSGGALGVTLFDSEEAMRRGDQVMNAGQGRAGARSSVEFYEVPLHTLESTQSA
jgi:hypothetical protein